jgi:hypothetical protein
MSGPATILIVDDNPVKKTQDACVPGKETHIETAPDGTLIPDANTGQLLQSALQSEEKWRGVSAELVRRTAEQTPDVENANAALRDHRAEQEGVEDQLKTSIREAADFTAAPDKPANATIINSGLPGLIHWQRGRIIALVAGVIVAVLAASRLPDGCFITKRSRPLFPARLR